MLKRLLTEGGCGDYLIVPAYNCTGFAQFEPYDFYESDIYHNPKFVCDGVFFFGSDNTIDEIFDHPKHPYTRELVEASR